LESAFQKEGSIYGTDGDYSNRGAEPEVVVVLTMSIIGGCGAYKTGGKGRKTEKDVQRQREHQRYQAEGSTWGQ
jgi:hypothetical protein